MERCLRNHFPAPTVIYGTCPFVKSFPFVAVFHQDLQECNRAFRLSCYIHRCDDNAFDTTSFNFLFHVKNRCIKLKVEI